MPNWCHSTLTVQGEEEPLKAFVEAVRESDERPLSFAKIVPQPSDEELRALEQYQPCSMCGAHGVLPETPEQASEWGARWYTWMDPREREDRTCNVCGGSKQERVGREGWYSWRVEHWGTKWDASFSEDGAMGVGGETMDVTVTKETQGATVTPTIAIYKFDTAWAPPVPAILAASEQHPDLEFVLRFAEMGENYAGETKCVSGELVEEKELEVEDVLAPEEMWF